MSKASTVEYVVYNSSYYKETTFILCMVVRGDAELLKIVNNAVQQAEIAEDHAELAVITDQLVQQDHASQGSRHTKPTQTGRNDKRKEKKELETAGNSIHVSRWREWNRACL